MSEEQSRTSQEGDKILASPALVRATHSHFTDGPRVLFIHGFTANAKYMVDLMTQFEGGGYKTYAFQYASYRGIDHAARSLRFLLEELNKDEAISRNRFVVVGHSMGGLVARALVSLEGGAKYVRKVLTFGTPHVGTLMTADLLRATIKWAEHVSGLMSLAYLPESESCKQLLGMDAPTPLLVRLQAPLPPGTDVEFFSISGGLPDLKLGQNRLQNFVANKWIQRHLTKPNDGLVSEESSNLAQPTMAKCAPGCVHFNTYPEYNKTNHTYLVNNQSVALAAMRLAAA